MEGALGSSPTQAQQPRPTAQQGFADVAQKHLAAVVGQVLLAEGCKDVSLWQPIITRLALDAAHAVLPSALAAFGVSDPRFYIKVSEPHCHPLLTLFVCNLEGHCCSANALACFAVI